MNKKLLNRLDFKNGQLEKWLNHDSFNLKKLETFDQTELD